LATSTATSKKLLIRIGLPVLSALAIASIIIGLVTLSNDNKKYEAALSNQSFIANQQMKDQITLLEETLNMKINLETKNIFIQTLQNNNTDIVKAASMIIEAMRKVEPKLDYSDETVARVQDTITISISKYQKNFNLFKETWEDYNQWSKSDFLRPTVLNLLGFPSENLVAIDSDGKIVTGTEAQKLINATVD